MVIRKARTPASLGVQPLGSDDIVEWLDADGRAQRRRIGTELLHVSFDQALRARVPAMHHFQRSHRGYYAFAGDVGHHVWHESMPEYTALMMLDHEQTVVAISAQPMLLRWANRWEGQELQHYPDYYVQLRDGTQALVDVRPNGDGSERDLAKFEQTKRTCEQVGWGYLLMTGLTLIERQNLELIAAHRARRYAPAEETATAFLQVLNAPIPLHRAMQLLAPGDPAHRIHELYHLIWTRRIDIDMTRPITLATSVWRSA